MEDGIEEDGVRENGRSEWHLRWEHHSGLGSHSLSLPVFFSFHEEDVDNCLLVSMERLDEIKHGAACYNGSFVVENVVVGGHCGDRGEVAV